MIYKDLATFGIPSAEEVRNINPETDKIYLSYWIGKLEREIANHNYNYKTAPQTCQLEKLVCLREILVCIEKTPKSSKLVCFLNFQPCHSDLMKELRRKGYFAGLTYEPVGHPKAAVRIEISPY